MVDSKTLVEAAALAALPAVLMFIGSIVAFKVKWAESQTVLCITQHFSAGLLIAAIGDELMPKLFETDHGQSKVTAVDAIAIAVGFFGGVGIMLLLEHFLDDDDDESEADAEQARSQASRGGAAAPGSAQGSTGARPLMSSSRASSKGGSRRGHASIGRVSAALASVVSDKVEAVPWGTAVPIYVDSAVDGMLVGIVAVASISGGAVMATATGIEMCFLGLTFGAMLRKCGGKRWFVALLAPIFLVIAGVVGALAADALTQCQPAFKGIVAFGASALLFLVVEELLKEAQENVGDEEWKVSPTIYLFLGFFVVVLTGLIFPEGTSSTTTPAASLLGANV